MDNNVADWFVVGFAVGIMFATVVICLATIFG
jgi:hypothetical protein